MTHHDQIKSLIQPHLETKIFPKFLLWILSDPKYGSINQTNEPKSIKATQTVIDLYKEWINTGKKPDKELWLKAREAAYDAAYATDAADAADADAAYADAAYAAVDKQIPRSEVESAQIDYLEKLIKNNGEDDENDQLYSWEDYEKDEEREEV